MAAEVPAAPFLHLNLAQGYADRVAEVRRVDAMPITVSRRWEPSAA